MTMKFKKEFLSYLANKYLNGKGTETFTRNALNQLHKKIYKKDICELLEIFTVPCELLMNNNIEFTKKEIKSIILNQPTIFAPVGTLRVDLAKVIYDNAHKYLHMRNDLTFNEMVANKEIINWNKYVSCRKVDEIELPEDVLTYFQTEKFKGNKIISSILLIHDINSFK